MSVKVLSSRDLKDFLEFGNLRDDIVSSLSFDFHEGSVGVHSFKGSLTVDEVLGVMGSLADEVHRYLTFSVAHPYVSALTSSQVISRVGIDDMLGILHASHLDMQMLNCVNRPFSAEVEGEQYFSFRIFKDSAGDYYVYACSDSFSTGTGELVVSYFLTSSYMFMCALGSGVASPYIFEELPLFSKLVTYQQVYLITIGYLVSSVLDNSILYMDLVKGIKSRLGIDDDSIIDLYELSNHVESNYSRYSDKLEGMDLVVSFLDSSELMSVGWMNTFLAIYSKDLVKAVEKYYLSVLARASKSVKGLDEGNRRKVLVSIKRVLDYIGGVYSGLDSRELFSYDRMSGSLAKLGVSERSIFFNLSSFSSFLSFLSSNGTLDYEYNEVLTLVGDIVGGDYSTVRGGKFSRGGDGSAMYTLIPDDIIDLTYVVGGLKVTDSFMIMGRILDSLGMGGLFDGSSELRSSLFSHLRSNLNEVLGSLTSK